jgi:hypothetical protein
LKVSAAARRLQYRDQDGIHAFSVSFVEARWYWKVNVWQGDGQPTYVQGGVGSLGETQKLSLKMENDLTGLFLLGHVFILHVHKNASVDLYQSFVKQYNLGCHIDEYEAARLRPMTAKQATRHVLHNLITLIEATEWTDAESDAYLKLFHFDVRTSVSASLEAAQIATKRFYNNVCCIFSNLCFSNIRLRIHTLRTRSCSTVLADLRRRHHYASPTNRQKSTQILRNERSDLRKS